MTNNNTCNSTRNSIYFISLFSSTSSTSSSSPSLPALLLVGTVVVLVRFVSAAIQVFNYYHEGSTSVEEAVWKKMKSEREKTRQNKLIVHFGLMRVHVCACGQCE